MSQYNFKKITVVPAAKVIDIPCDNKAIEMRIYIVACM